MGQMTWWMIALSLFSGLGLGGVVGWFLAASRYSAQNNRLSQINAAQESSKNTELRLLQEQYLSLQKDMALLQASQLSISLEKARLDTLLNESQQQEARFAQMGHHILRQIKEELQGEMENDYQQKQQQTQERIQHLLKPITDLIETHGKKVEAVEKQLGDVEKQRIDENSSLKTHIELMSKETRRMHDSGTKLAEALSNSKGRGDWGEMQLVRLLESSGLLPGVHYDMQDSMKDDGKLLRPDVTVRFSNNRLLYIDAKTILTNLERIEHATTEEGSQQERRRHVEALEKEILNLSAKAYDAKNPDSIDFIVLFVPRESMLRVALEERPNLMDIAFQRRVVLASPLILMAILRTVSLGWQEASLSQNAHEIQNLAKELHSRAATFFEKFLKLEEKLQGAVRQFDETKTALNGRRGMVPQIIKLEDYGCKSNNKSVPLSLVSAMDNLEPVLESSYLNPVDVEDTQLETGVLGFLK